VKLHFRIPFVVIIALVVQLAGCAESRPRERTDATVKQSLAVSHEQVRLRMRGLAEPMCGQIEQSADSIIAATTDHKLQLAALDWKIDAVPAMREALFQPNAFAAALDTMVLLNQMIDYFDTGPGKHALGPASPQAVATCRTMEEEFNRVLVSATTSGQLPKVRDYSRKWAKDHPITGSISSRQSVLARAFEKDFDTSLSASELVAEMSTTMDDLNRKLGVYSSQLIRQARWETERFKLQMVSEFELDKVIPLARQGVELEAKATGTVDRMAATVDRLTPSVERSLALVQEIPKLIASERQSAFKELHDERTGSVEDLRRERVVAINAINDIAIRERQQALSGADQITMKGIDYSVQRIIRIGAVAMAVGAVLALLGMVVAWHLFVRRESGRLRSRSDLREGTDSRGRILK
jgi:hypothetical protein